MTPAEIRLKLIELARPQVSMPDVDVWLKRAAELEAWVIEPTETPPAAEGQATTPPTKRGPGKSRKPGEPEFGPALNV